jgi:hypothetical protein
MLLVKALLAVQAANALFMWFPEYRCILHYPCISSGGQVGTEVAGRGLESLKSLEIVQKLPEVVLYS